MSERQQPGHIAVLVHEVLEALHPGPGEVYLDCTAGLGGHAAAIAPGLGASGTIVLNDADPSNLRHSEARVAIAGPAKVVALHGNFADAPRRLKELGLRADMVLADLGFSSNQVETPERGFSFQRDGPLDMRLDPTQPTTAADLVASAPESDLARLIRDYGEEPAAGRIARKLVEARGTAPISTTGRLAEVVRLAIGRKPGAIDPATRTFQALRIAVNDELGSLEALLAAIQRGARDRESWLKAGARVAIISFHSLEDRLVKRAFAAMVADGTATQNQKRPIEASEVEVAANARSRSAKLRVVTIAG